MDDEKHPAPRMHAEFVQRFPELGRTGLPAAVAAWSWSRNVHEEKG